MTAKQLLSDFVAEAIRTGGMSGDAVTIESGGQVNGRRTGPPIKYDSAMTLNQGVGYSYFVATFYFDADGNLVAHGVWE